MNCETSTIVDTSSLYKNGRLIAQTDASFMVQRCDGIDFKICSDIVCICNRRKLRVCFITTNTGDNTINSGIVKVIVTPKCCCCNCCCNSQYIEFPINNLRPRCSQKDCIFLPLNCYAHYKIKAQIEVNGTILKEDCVTV